MVRVFSAGGGVCRESMKREGASRSSVIGVGRNLCRIALLKDSAVKNAARHIISATSQTSGN